jgi:hypothetical protein
VWCAMQVCPIRGTAKGAGRLSHSFKQSYRLGVAVSQLKNKVCRVNVVMLMLLCDVLEYPDVGLPRAYCKVFPSPGDPRQS